MVHGAHLVEIETKTENDFVLTLASKVGDRVWLGGNDMFFEEHWFWVGSKRPINYTNWAPGKPDPPGTGAIEDCMDMYYTAQGYPGSWNDSPCLAKYNFICEAEPIEFIPVG